MNSGFYDIVVIGGGFSGLMAAITLADEGKRVAVVSRGNPVCCLSTGCIDVLSGHEDPIRGIAALPDEHPYHLAGEEATVRALGMFRDIMAGANLPYMGDVHENRTIFTPLGTQKTTCLVPRSMESAHDHGDDYFHVVSFRGIKDFYPSYIMSRHARAGSSFYDAGVSATSAIAERFEDKTFLRKFISWLKGLDIPAGSIAIPAVLGTRSAPLIFDEISREIQRRIFEIPTLPPSMPGQRLFSRLKNTFLARGGSLYWGRDIASVERLGDQIEAVTIASAGRPSRVQGKAFILATGSFVSGGLYATMDGVKETVFGLPTYLPDGRSTWFNDSFFVPGHAIEKSGIRVDSTFRPLHAGWSNLFVCGSILAFSEVMKYGCGHGLAIATGVAAATMCERQV